MTKCQAHLKIMSSKLEELAGTVSPPNVSFSTIKEIWGEFKNLIKWGQSQGKYTYEVSNELFEKARIMSKFCEEGFECRRKIILRDQGEDFDQNNCEL